MHRSHLTQELLNYFDSADPYIRQGQSTLDAQLLNTVACEMESLERRIRLGRDAKYVSTCPLNIDNRGVWHRVIVPSSLGEVRQVRGYVDGTWINLRQYSAELPIPSRIEIERTIDPAIHSSPVLFSIAGGADMQMVEDLDRMAVPNFLYLQASNLGETFGPVDVVIEGYPYPQTAGQRRLTSETVVITDEVPVSTITIWSEVRKVEVRGLPADAVLTGMQYISAFSYVPDLDRPFTHPDLRDLPMDRFWTIDGRFLKEVYFAGRFVGYEDIQSYFCPTSLTGVAVEPNTAGIWATDGTKLYYMDRREPMPDNLHQTGLVEEPLYNLLVKYDRTEHHTRYVELTPLAASRASECHKHRYLLQFNDRMEVVAPDGALLDFSPYAGWRPGAPKPLKLPVIENGSYLFILETQDTLGHTTRDVVAYANLHFSPLATFDLSGMVPKIEAVLFDGLQRLWVWDGTQLVPLRIHYDAYLMDHSTRQPFVYLTDDYQQVELT